MGRTMGDGVVRGRMGSVMTMQYLPMCEAALVVEVCCSVLQCVVWQCVAVCCSVLQCVAVCCVAVCGGVLQCVVLQYDNDAISANVRGSSSCRGVLQCVVLQCVVWQCMAV